MDKDIKTLIEESSGIKFSSNMTMPSDDTHKCISVALHIDYSIPKQSLNFSDYRFFEVSEFHAVSADTFEKTTRLKLRVGVPIKELISF